MPAYAPSGQSGRQRVQPARPRPDGRLAAGSGMWKGKSRRGMLTRPRGAPRACTGPGPASNRARPSTLATSPAWPGPRRSCSSAKEEIEILRRDGPLGQHRDHVVGHFDETALDIISRNVAGAGDPHFAVTQPADQRRVAGGDADLAVKQRQGDEIRLLRRGRFARASLRCSVGAKDGLGIGKAPRLRRGGHPASRFTEFSSTPISLLVLPPVGSRRRT